MKPSNQQRVPIPPGMLKLRDVITQQLRDIEAERLRVVSDYHAAVKGSIATLNLLIAEVERIEVEGDEFILHYTPAEPPASDDAARE
jgi:hypothetical protein